MVVSQVTLFEMAKASGCDKAVVPAPTLLGSGLLGLAPPKNFDEALFVGIDGLNHQYVIDWDKDENRLPVKEVDDITIPGRGVITDVDKCGSFHGSYIAGDKLRAKLYSCHKPSCPRCFREWASRQGKHSAAFIWGIKNWSGDTIYHSVWSPVEGVYTIPKLVAVVKKLMEEFHSGSDLGYAYVIHPYRIKCLGGHPSPRERGYSGGRLPQVCSLCGMPWQWVYSPHIHMVTNFYVDCTSKVKADAWNQAQSNANVKYANISQDNHFYDLTHQVLVPRPGYVDSFDTLESIIKYELGHSLVHKGGRQQAIIYVGAWCRLNFKADWASHKEIVCDDNDVPFRRVHSVGVVDGSKMKISAVFTLAGQPSWWNDWDDSPVYLYDRVYTCVVSPRRRWCRLHHRFERVDPLKRVGKKDLENCPLDKFGDVDG